MGTWPPEKMRKWVTLYADAGWKEGRARCGWVVRSSLEPSWLRGSQDLACENSLVAEYSAVLYGLENVCETYDKVLSPEKLEGVFLRSDCQGVIFSLQNLNLLLEDRGALPVLRKIRSFCLEHDLTISAKHVPAHGKEKDSKKRWMNSQADRLGNMRGR